jgi:hypothetical protein
MQRIPPENWYSMKGLEDDVTYISEPFIQEFYRCNIWHVRGRDRDMLVDSGMGVVSLLEWVPVVTRRETLSPRIELRSAPDRNPSSRPIGRRPISAGTKTGDR